MGISSLDSLVGKPFGKMFGRFSEAGELIAVELNVF